MNDTAISPQGQAGQRPTVYITNWSSKLLHGPGTAYTIMAMARAWERGAGIVLALTPNVRDLLDVKAGSMDMADYRKRFILKLTKAGRNSFRPGSLKAASYVVDGSIEVLDGDTLCCACAKDAAARGECHRVWAAEALHKAGWTVILDRTELQALPLPPADAQLGLFESV